MRFYSGIVAVPRLKLCCFQSSLCLEVVLEALLPMQNRAYSYNSRECITDVVGRLAGYDAVGKLITHYLSGTNQDEVHTMAATK